MEALPPNPNSPPPIFDLDYLSDIPVHDLSGIYIIPASDSNPPQSPQTLASAAEIPFRIPEAATENSDNESCTKPVSNGEEEEETSSKRRRRSRWDPQPESDEGSRKRKSRRDDEKEPKPVVKVMEGIEFDPEIQALNHRHVEISRILFSGLVLDDRPEGERSRSPEPVYDNFGIRGSRALSREFADWFKNS